MLTPPPRSELHRVESVPAAVAALAELGDRGAPAAGCSWIMRASLRGEREPPTYVSLHGLRELEGIEGADGEWRIGACVTHRRLAARLAGVEALAALGEAAARSATPQIRAVATVGGNLCASGFPSPDLVPALIALDARVLTLSPSGAGEEPVEAFLARRAERDPAELVTGVAVPAPAGQRSSHRRLTVRSAADYPVAIVSIAARLGDGGRVASARVALSSVAPAPRRWPELEAALAGGPLDPSRAAQLARDSAQSLIGRDAADAPGWYRIAVLPALVEDAVRELAPPAGAATPPPANHSGAPR